MPRSPIQLWFFNGVINKEEDVSLVAKLYLFTINTIILPKSKILAMVATNAKIGIDAKFDTNAKINTNTKTNTNMKISINKLIFYFPHTLREFLIDIMPAWIKM